MLFLLLCIPPTHTDTQTHTNKHCQFHPAHTILNATRTGARRMYLHFGFRFKDINYYLLNELIFIAADNCHKKRITTTTKDE